MNDPDHSAATALKALTGQIEGMNTSELQSLMLELDQQVLPPIALALNLIANGYEEQSSTLTDDQVPDSMVTVATGAAALLNAARKIQDAQSYIERAREVLSQLTNKRCDHCKQNIGHPSMEMILRSGAYGLYCLEPECIAAARNKATNSTPETIQDNDD